MLSVFEISATPPKYMTALEGDCAGGALVCRKAEDANEIMWYATQARDAYPYYQHTAIGYNYRISNVCAGIGRGQMTVLDSHIKHHQHVRKLYEELLADVPGVHIHKQPEDPRYDANFWLCAATLDPSVHVQGQENAYKEVIKTAVGGAPGVIHAVNRATTDCQPNDSIRVGASRGLSGTSWAESVTSQAKRTLVAHKRIPVDKPRARSDGL